MRLKGFRVLAGKFPGRLFVLVIISAILCFSCSTAPQKPNLLFIAVDDLRPELNCYGADYIQSPNLDRLASEGFLFTNHYVSVPTCGASRYSLLTGNYPANARQVGNEAIRQEISGKEESEQPESWVHHLKRNGYYTIGIGKISHYVDGLLYGYTDSVGKELELPHSWDEMLFDAGQWETGWNAFFGYADGSNRQSMKRQVKPYESADVPDSGYPDGLSTQLAIKKLRTLENRKPKTEKPFLLAIGYFKPHLPFNAPKKYWDLYEDSEIPLAAFSDLPENVNRASLHNSGEFNAYQLGDEKATLEGPVSDEYARKLRQAYAACVSYIDAQIGLVLDELDRLDLSENTNVLIWGDHGWHLGDQRVWGKHTIFDYATRSTLLIKPSPNLKLNPPFQGTSKSAIDQIVGTVDLYPTIMELCGLEMPYPAPGRSLVCLIQNPGFDEWDNQTFSYFNRGISLRTERYRLTRYFRDPQPVIELYDHVRDPWESKNIAEENPKLVDSLMLIWKKGDTGIYR